MSTLYLIPTFLSEEFTDVVPQSQLEIIRNLDEFIVENAKTARHFLKKIKTNHPLPSIVLHELNEHTEVMDYAALLEPLRKGKSIGLMSDAGCPAVADPGSEIVRLAHRENITVKPFIGPSSILLALMASGMNGQSFVFHGYLPRDTAHRKTKLRELESESKRKKQTQIFIETPYRNEALIMDLLGVCQDETLFCIGADITAPHEKINTDTVKNWKKKVPNPGKKPCIYLILA